MPILLQGMLFAKIIVQEVFSVLYPDVHQLSSDFICKKQELNQGHSHSPCLTTTMTAYTSTTFSPTEKPYISTLPNSRKLQPSADYFCSNISHFWWDRQCIWLCPFPLALGTACGILLMFARSRGNMFAHPKWSPPQRRAHAPPQPHHNPGKGCFAGAPAAQRHASYNGLNYFSHLVHLKAPRFLLPKQCICKKCNNNVTEPFIWGVTSEQNHNKHKIKPGQHCSLIPGSSIAKCKVSIIVYLDIHLQTCCTVSGDTEDHYVTCLRLRKIHT